MRQGLETIRNRIDQFGVSEPVIQRQGIEGDRIVVQLPGVDDPTRVKEIIHTTAFLEIKPVVRRRPTEESLLAPSAASFRRTPRSSPGTSRTIEGRVIGKEYYLLKKASVVTGRDLRNARRSQDQYGQPAVNFTLTPDGAKKFGGYTGAHIGDRMAIVLDSKVLSAPVIRGAHPGLGHHRGQLQHRRAPRTWRWCCAPARCRPRSPTSRSGRSARRSGATRSSAGCGPAWSG